MNGTGTDRCSSSSRNVPLCTCVKETISLNYSVMLCLCQCTEFHISPLATGVPHRFYLHVCVFMCVCVRVCVYVCHGCVLGGLFSNIFFLPGAPKPLQSGDQRPVFLIYHLREQLILKQQLSCMCSA